MLVLVDGVRLNDAQSGHHNGDIPVPLDAVERIEVLYGPGSSLFGADAFGGTVNVITRRTVEQPALVVEGGSFGTGGRARVRLDSSAARSAKRCRAPSIGRPDSCTTATTKRRWCARAPRSATARACRSRICGRSLARTTSTAAMRRRANGPIRRWSPPIIAFARSPAGARAPSPRIARMATGSSSIRSFRSFRTTGIARMPCSRRSAVHAGVGAIGTLTVGVEGGGDWIRSTNLGDHSTARVSGFGEWRQDLGRASAARWDPSRRSLQRVRHVVEPVAGIGWWPTSTVRLRASAARAFRVPTFTERYYSDPANLAREEVGPETAWAGEGGADLLLPGGWIAQATMFGRADEDVIDWLRPTTADRWRTYNIRDVDTRGVELGIRKTFASGPMVLAEYTALDVDAAAVTQLSKYVLDYAPHSFVAAAVPSAARCDSAPRRGSNTVAARAQRARSTTSSSMPGSAGASGSTSSCSWTDATCSTRAIRKSPASRCRGLRWRCPWRLAEVGIDD